MSDNTKRNDPARRLPWFAEGLLRRLLPRAERDEVLGDLAEEYAVLRSARGWWAAERWLWRQVAGSAPWLVRRSWWRGWSGFEPRANRMRSGGPMLESWIMDARYSARRLMKRPGYAVLAVLTLALGVGSTAAIYTIARGLLLEPLPYAAEEELAVFWFPYSWTEQEFLALRPDVAGFRGVAAYRSEDVTAELGGTARLIAGVSASAELFEVLGAKPMLGSGFQPEHDAQGSAPVAVLSHDLWQELGADRAMVGQTLRLDGEARAIVGVMPPGFWFPQPTTRVWLAEPLSPEATAGMYTLVGRMAPGQRADGMQAALGRITEELDARFDYPEQWDKTRDPALTPVREYLVGSVRPALIATLAAMAVLLLMACANVTALMLGQVDGRAGEMAVRLALGAGRRRMLQQMTIEALLVGVLAGVVGAVLATAGFRLLLGALPLGALAETATVSWTVFGAAMAISVAAAMLVAIIPAVALWRGDLRGVLTAARTSGVAGRGGRMEGGLVVAEVALAVLMVAAAGLLIRSVDKLRAIDPGLDAGGVAVVDVAMPGDIGHDGRRRVLEALVPELAALPGVGAAGAVQKLPLRGRGDNWGIMVEDRPELERSTTAFRMVTPEYLDAMGIEVVRGRGFQDSDRHGSEPVVVVNEALVEKYFGDLDPIGRRVTGGGTWARVVGVVENAAESGLTDPDEPARYVLFEHSPMVPDGAALVLRVDGGANAAAVLEAARRTVQRVTPGVAVESTTTMEQVVEEAMGPVRQVKSLLTLLAGLALALGAIGVYGVVSHFVLRRRREWGIRMALGLTPAQVVARVVGRGGALVGLGIALGAVAALLLMRLLAAFLYGVGTADPLAMGGAAATLLLAGVLAALIPALRASRTDPIIALREQ